MKIQGWDISLNHGAMVEFTDSELTNFFYYTNKAGSAARSKAHGVRLRLLKTKDKQERASNRLFQLRAIFAHWLKGHLADFIAIEDYALRAEQGAHQLGEVGAIARLAAMDSGARLRLHDPISLKMFVTHNGRAEKDVMEETVLRRWGQDFARFNQPLPEPTKRTPEPEQDRQTSGDLCDAYGLAQMVLVEVGVREGSLSLSRLHAKEVQVFNRITKTYPVNLLDRDWLTAPKGLQ